MYAGGRREIGEVPGPHHPWTQPKDPWCILMEDQVQERDRVVCDASGGEGA